MIPSVSGLSRADATAFEELSAQLNGCVSRNKLLTRYYDHEATLNDLGISIPPSLRSIDTVIGWPQKAVDSMADRIVMEGWTSGDAPSADLGVDVVWDANLMDVQAPQVHSSALLHACAFLFVSAGDPSLGEPEVLVTARDANTATGMWDGRTRSLRTALSVIDVDANGTASRLAMWLPDRVVIMQSTGVGWDISESRHALGVPVHVVAHNARLAKPFGRSRITPAVRAFTDMAVRSLVRAEVSAEFFSAPQRYLLGADEDVFTDADGRPIPSWSAVLGRLLRIGRDEEGEIPTVGQFPQQSQQPHIDQIRGIAAMFAGEASLPLDELGIVQDNPSSAEAIGAAKEPLVVKCERFIRDITPAWRRTMVDALSMIDASPAALAEYAHLRPKWRNPATPSIASLANAGAQQVGAMPWLAETEVGLELIGLDADQRERALAERARAQGVSVLERIANGVQAQSGP